MASGSFGEPLPGILAAISYPKRAWRAVRTGVASFLRSRELGEWAEKQSQNLKRAKEIRIEAREWVQ